MNKFWYQTFEDYAAMSPEELAENLIMEYSETIPEGLESPDDIDLANNLLGKYTNQRTALLDLFGYIKSKTAILKMEGKKEEYNEMMIRRNIVETVLKGVEGRYDGVSRMLTARKQKYDELRMLQEGPRYGQPPAC